MMDRRSIKLLKVILILSLLMSVAGCSKDAESDIVVTKECNDWCYTVPSFCWLKVNAGGTATLVFVCLALAVGVMMYIIGYFSGGRGQKTKILAAMGIATCVGILGRSGMLFVQLKVSLFLAGILGDQLLAVTISEIIFYSFWIFFLTGISVYSYETFIVTAKEAHPMS